MAMTKAMTLVQKLHAAKEQQARVRQRIADEESTLAMAQKSGLTFVIADSEEKIRRARLALDVSDGLVTDLEKAVGLGKKP